VAGNAPVAIAVAIPAVAVPAIAIAIADVTVSVSEVSVSGIAVPIRIAAIAVADGRRIDVARVEGPGTPGAREPKRKEGSQLGRTTHARKTSKEGEPRSGTL
jgi:hypothetical protein